jgi:hypothetical protein
MTLTSLHATTAAKTYSEQFVEDTHTSIEMFKRGWTSVYINVKREHLSECVLEPKEAKGRIRQVSSSTCVSYSVSSCQVNSIVTNDDCAVCVDVWCQHKCSFYSASLLYCQRRTGVVLLLLEQCLCRCQSYHSLFLHCVS